MAGTKIRKDGIWLIDGDNNRASVEYFGTEKAARKALLSLKNCKNCINCSGRSGCSGKIGFKPIGDAKPTEITIPKIENIHSVIYAAASAPQALDMGNAWHTCEKTHCRSGGSIMPLPTPFNPKRLVAELFGPHSDAQCADILEAVGDYWSGYRADDALEDAVADLRFDASRPPYNCDQLHDERREMGEAA